MMISAHDDGDPIDEVDAARAAKLHARREARIRAMFLAEDVDPASVDAVVGAFMWSIKRTSQSATIQRAALEEAGPEIDALQRSYSLLSEDLLIAYVRLYVAGVPLPPEDDGISSLRPEPPALRRVK